MQFYIITPLFLYLYVLSVYCFVVVNRFVRFYKSRILGWSVVVVASICSLLSSAWTVYNWDLSYFVLSPKYKEYMTWNYVKPFVRILPYLVGIGLGRG